VHEHAGELLSKIARASSYSPPMQHFICVPCALPADAAGNCARCGDVLLDARRDDVRELLDDIDSRRKRAREQRMLWLSIVLAFVIAAALWSIPGFWEARRYYFALPLLLDQLILIGLLSFGLLKLNARLFPARPRFARVTGSE
jgi:hypothetical protein